MTPQISSTSPITIGLQGNQITHETSTTIASNMKLLDSTPDLSHPSLPHSVKGPLVWSGPKLTNNKGYTFYLSSDDVVEVEKALDAFKRESHDSVSEFDCDKVSTSNYPLPALGPKLKECARSLYDGMGLVVIHGLDSEKYSDKDNLLMYLGMSSYIGDLRGVQDKKGNMLAHVTDSKQWKKVPIAARHGIHQHGTLPFHTDMPAEILALQVRQCAQQGGATCVSSVGAVYNELSLCHPDELRALATPNWPIQVSGKKQRFIYSPLLQVVDGKVLACLDVSRLGPHPKSGIGRVPNLTPIQLRSLSALMEVASRHQIRIQARPGDLVFINNFAMLHSREEYKDGETTARHLIRMWLRNTTLGWTIPDNMKSAWLTAFGPRATTATPKYPVIPNLDYEVPRYTAGSAAFIVEDSSSDDEDELEVAGPST